MAVYSRRQLNEQQEMIGVVRALTALTVVRLKKTYDAIQENKELLLEIDASKKRVFEVYPASDLSLKKRRSEFIDKKRRDQEKIVLVFISSSHDFYGDLIFDISKLFIADFKRTQSDAVIIGNVGKAILAREKVASSRIKFFELDDNRPNLQVLAQIFALLEEYDRILVYHGKTESLLRQSASKSEVLKQASERVKPRKKYIFEPAAFEVLDFLQIQTTVNSLHQHLNEAQYARLAAKRWNWTKQQMTRAKLLEELTRQFLQFKKSLMQKQQQVAIFAHRQNILDNPNIKNTNIYGW